MSDNLMNVVSKKEAETILEMECAFEWGVDAHPPQLIAAICEAYPDLVKQYAERIDWLKPLIPP